MSFQRMIWTGMALLFPLVTFASTSTAAKTLQSMRDATSRLEQLMESKDRQDEANVLQETWDILHESSLSDEANRGTDDFMHEFFTLTDTYMKADNSGAAMDVFSAYYEEHKKQVDAYRKKTSRKTSTEVIERVLAAEKAYGSATDSPQRDAKPSQGTRGTQ